MRTLRRELDRADAGGDDRRWRWLPLAMVLLFATGGFAAVAAGTTATSPPAPTFGRLPDLGPSASPGDVYGAAPDFISVWNRDGTAIAGYIKKTDMAALVNGHLMLHAGPVDVYDSTGKVVVGRMIPGKGFVGVGEDPNQVPDSSGDVQQSAVSDSP